MNQQERDDLAKKLINLALFYGKYDLTKNAVMQFINILESFYNKSYIDYENALNNYSAEASNKNFPAPSQLKQYLFPNSSSRQQAQEIAQRCFGAIRKFGYTKPVQAKEYIGELGWRLIERRGGWSSHCCNTQESDIPILTAQFRESISVYVDQGITNDQLFFDKVGLTSSKENVLMIEQKPKENEKEQPLEKPQKLILEIKRPIKRNEQDFDINKAKEEAIARFTATYGCQQED